ncbi:MAG: hypothetical protein ACQZ3N_04190 [cyanobacterium endosymbiont of Rhopalodia yunnanensis]
MTTIQSPIILTIGKLIQDNFGTTSLEQEVVYYCTPPEVKTKIIEFIKNYENHNYKDVQGLKLLFYLIFNKFEQDDKIYLKSNQSIILTDGEKMAFINAIFACSLKAETKLFSICLIILTMRLQS